MNQKADNKQRKISEIKYWCFKCVNRNDKSLEILFKKIKGRENKDITTDSTDILR